MLQFTANAINKQKHKSKRATTKHHKVHQVQTAVEINLIILTGEWRPCQ